MFRVLIFGSEPENREELKSLFEKENDFEVSQTGSEGTALELAKSHEPKLILVATQGPLPIQMVEALAEIAPDTTIFLITAAYDVNIEKASLRCGVTAVFANPGDMEMLIANARAIAEESGRGEAAASA